MSGSSQSRQLTFGFRFVTNFLPTETYAETLALKIASEEAFRLGASVLSKLRKLGTNDDIKPPHPILKAVVGSGILDMNPAIVREGLIKQDTASTAVKRVISKRREITART